MAGRRSVHHVTVKRRAEIWSSNPASNEARSIGLHSSRLNPGILEDAKKSKPKDPLYSARVGLAMRKTVRFLNAVAHVYWAVFFCLWQQHYPWFADHNVPNAKAS